MAVLVGSARSDENHGISGGKAGDQTGLEVSTCEWYLHSLGWIVLRAKDPEKAEKIAQDMEFACTNNLIGYDQGENTTLLVASKPFDYNCSKVKEACETDCSGLVRVCVLYAGINVGWFSTANEVDELMKTGQFEKLIEAKYTTSSDYLKRGDILVTKTRGHTEVVLSNGSKAVEKPKPEMAYAEEYDKAVAGSYKVLTDLYLRTAPVNGTAIYVMKEGKTARCYGYYSVRDNKKWLFVQYGKYTGFASSKYLRKV